jgi:hypothetical protein
MGKQGLYSIFWNGAIRCRTRRGNGVSVSGTGGQNGRTLSAGIPEDLHLWIVEKTIDPDANLITRL